MDFKVFIDRFFDDRGSITLPPQLTLAGLGELVYQQDLATGGEVDRPVLTHWVYGTTPHGETVTYSRREINTRVKAVAARLQQVAALGDRVAILAGNSPEYIFGFIGAMYAGMLPIPLYDPNEPGHTDHLNAVFGDSDPKVVLTNSTSAAAVRRHFSDRPAKERPRILVVDTLPESLAQSYQQPHDTPEGRALAANSAVAPLDTPAFLQYTSGSTRTPAGVQLTNRSILTNVMQIFKSVEVQLPARLVTWLPLHHDMGIILVTFAVLLGIDFELMTPRDFVQQPKRWVDQIKRRDGDEELGGVYAVIPNFALELSARYGRPAEGEELDLSNITGIIIGSEPVTESAVTRFIEAFGDHGLQRDSLRPSYGMAEATLMVTTPQTPHRPRFEHFDRAQLAAGQAVPSEKSADTVTFTSNGQPVPAQYLTIVDPDTRAELADGHVGEIWVHGKNVAGGYLRRPEETAVTFANTLGERLAQGSRVDGAPEHDKWLATGDLGVILDGEVFITGRLKDLIVVAGRNHYPQDIEATVHEASDHVRPDSVAAFSVEGESTESLILLVERADSATPDGDAQAAEAIRAAVTKHHGVTPEDIRFYAPHEINRTTSGKIARRVAKKHYLEQAGRS